MVRAAALLALSLSVPACAPAEDPMRATLRARLEQEEALSPAEVDRVFDEVNRSLAGRTVRAVRGSAATALVPEEREVVLGMLSERVGVFDEGLRAMSGARVRVFNAPGHSTNPEIEAMRRLFLDIDSFLPRRFEFAYAFPSPEDYAFDLAVD